MATRRAVRLATLVQLAFLALCLSAFLALAAHQLQLPGLHYDEAKEAGLNAMQLVTGQPVTAFRDVTVQVGPWRLPLMVQDYIGALNPLLAVPFLAVARLDIADPVRGVIALRWLPLLIGAATLALAWLVARRLGGPVAAAVTASLLAVNPAFVFWSRQGVFVTNLTALFFMASLLTGLRWWQLRRPLDLWLTALFCGLGVYAKLLFAWAIGAMVLVAAVAWLLEWRHKRAGPGPVRREDLATWLVAAGCFLAPLVPLILFNLRTEGTLISIFGNLSHSYYGVDNLAYVPNLLVRIGQVGALLRGDFLWYIGEVFANGWAVWGVAGLAALAWIKQWLTGQEAERPAPGRWLWLPVVLLVLMVAQSAFTVSDLFITHYVLLLPLFPLTGGLAVASLLRKPARTTTGIWPGALRVLFALAALFGALGWGGQDLWTTVRYHQTLAISGGYGGHSDAVFGLAQYLSRGGPSAPLALDWGMDAPLRFLTVGRVNPVEVFGYESTQQPDAGFDARVAPFLDNPDNVYLAHAGDETVFKGRVEALAALAAQHNLALREEAQFRERNGRPLFVVYRIVRP